MRHSALLLAVAGALIVWLRAQTHDVHDEDALPRIYTVYTCLLLTLAAFSVPWSDEKNDFVIA